MGHACPPFYGPVPKVAFTTAYMAQSLAWPHLVSGEARDVMFPWEVTRLAVALPFYYRRYHGQLESLSHA